jgi:hypothetical protein
MHVKECNLLSSESTYARYSKDSIYANSMAQEFSGCAAFLGGMVGEMEPSTNEIMILLNGIPG